MSKLAVFGGSPVRTELFSAYNTIGKEEIVAVNRVLQSGVLSKYLGCWHDDFYGGECVQEFEQSWSKAINAKHSISINSNTSGLITAMGAADIKPGDEVIVSPYSMSASAIAPIFWGGIPVFADIDENNFCISVESIKSKITERTKAILVVHIFGYPADMDEIMSIAKEHDLYVIEDAAQAPLAKYKDKYVGTIGDMGVFSFNYHKHIHTGEGGIITTNNDDLAERCQLIRNHGEAVVEDKGVKNISNILGYNFRLGEMEAAIGIEQIKKSEKLISDRIENAKYLIDNLKGIDYLDLCIPNPDVVHSYYVQAFKYFEEKNNGVSRTNYLKAICAELPSSYMREEDPLISGGYVKPIYLQPIYQQKAFNVFNYNKESLNYDKGICPVTERMHFKELITHEFMRPSMSKSDLDQVIEAFLKVDKYRDELASRQNEL